MRVMFTATFPVETANAVAKAGKLGSIIQSILEEQKPEAAYFTDRDGRRCAILILDLTDPSRIPAIAEPWMLALNASIECHPVMVPADLAKASAGIEQAVKKYGG